MEKKSLNYLKDRNRYGDIIIYGTKVKIKKFRYEKQQ